MKFTCDKDILLSAITSAAKAVNPKSFNDILKGLLFTVEGNALCVTGNDLVLGIQSKAEVDAEKEGSAVIDARVVTEIVKKLPDMPVCFCRRKNFVSITCGMSEFSVQTSPANEFPPLPEIGDSQMIRLPHKTLKSMLARTLFAVGADETRPILTGALLEGTGDNLTIVALDGFRMALAREQVECGDASDFRFTAPGSTLRELERILTNQEDAHVTIHLGESHILFSMEENTFVSRLLEGEFIQYDAIIPQSFSCEYKLDARELRGGVERVALMADNKQAGKVKVKFGEEQIDLKCTADMGNANDRIPCMGRGELIAGFNHRLLLDVLKAAPDENICIGIDGSFSPAVITPEDGDNWLFLVLPMRMQEAEYA